VLDQSQRPAADGCGRCAHRANNFGRGCTGRRSASPTPRRACSGARQIVPSRIEILPIRRFGPQNAIAS
jgi:hypothetical protein